MKKVLSVLLAALLMLTSLGAAALAVDDVETVSTYAEAVAFVRAGLVARQETIRFRYAGEDGGAPATDDLFAYVADGAAGDYLRLSFNGAFPTVTQEEDGSYTVTAAYYTTAEQEAAVADYVAEILNSYHFGTEKGKAKGLYEILCDNVLFDLENLYDETVLLKYTAYGAVAEGKAVCQGFAQLYYRLAKAAGLDCRIVTGTRAGENHAWNIIRIDNLWYHVDASSGSQLLDNAGYFMKPLFNNYSIIYGDYTADEIKDYSFVSDDDLGNTAAGTLTDSISWRIDETYRLIIEGSGEIPSYSGSSSPFESIKNKFNSVYISEGITSVGSYAFYNCSQVKQIIIAEGVTSIADNAFLGCTELNSISLPASLTEIAGRAFMECRNLSRLQVNELNPVFYSTEGCLINRAEKELTVGCRGCTIPDDGSVTSIGESALAFRLLSRKKTIPNSVTVIKPYAFFCCSAYGIVFPDNLTSIGNNAFWKAGLSEISLPEGISEIGENAFAFTGVRSVTIPDSLTCISDGMFSSCKNLTEVHIGSGVTCIGSFAFSDCSSLTEITIPDGVVQIKNDAFNWCTGLKKVSLPKSLENMTHLTSLWPYFSVFDHCVNLEEIVVDSDNPYYCSSGNCLIEIQTKYLLRGCKNSVIPSDGSVTTIKDWAFSGCTDLNLVIPDSITTIEPSVFSNCTNVTLYGHSGSYAETYANENNIPFRVVCPVSDGLHNEVAVEATEATCTDGAYSAGVQCAGCGEWISGHEQTAEPLGHSPAEAVRENVTEPTCTQEGSYDNVVRCSRCGVILSSIPEKLAMVPHKDEIRDGYCDDCGAYICEHTETEMANEKAVSCTENGYSGDTVCLICGVTLTYGETIFSTGHTPYISKAAKPATCLDPGATAEYACSVCHVVLTESESTPIAGHADDNGDGVCDVCRAPLGCEQYGRCGDELFWYVENETLVLIGSGASYEFEAAPWQACADAFNCVYIKEGVDSVDGSAFDGCARVTRILAPAGTAVTNADQTVLGYACADGVMTLSRVTGEAAFDAYDLLNTIYVFCEDHTISKLHFDSLTLNAADGGGSIEYDILKAGKIVDENHFRVPSGTTVTDFTVRPVSYSSFNSAFDALGDHPDRNLILSIVCPDLLTDEQQADAAAYTVQLVVRFVDDPVEPSGSPDEEGQTSLWDIVVARFKATLAAILALLKKIIKLFTGK